MLKKKIWLPISIFCHSSKWVYLLKYLDTSFISHSRGQKGLLDFYVAINFSKGHNIRLSLLVEEGAVREWLIYTEMKVSHFFEMRPLRLKFQNNNDDIFLPFNDNSILYALYKVPNLCNIKSESSLIKSLSKRILRVYSKDSYDPEATISLCVYLNLIYLKAVKGEFTNVFERLLEEYNSIGLESNPIVYQIFQQNENLLRQIEKEVLIQECLPFFLRLWSKTCQSFLQHVRNIHAHDYDSTVNVIPELIINQLGLDNHGVIIKYFISQVVNQDITK